MPHSVTLISTLAAAFGLALLMGFAAVRLRLPALVGYLIAGILVGPATPGFVADAELSGQLAEIGVMLLMFGVGLYFSLDDLLAVRRMIETARALNPGIETVVRTHSEEEARLMQQEKAGTVFMGEHELAAGMTRHVLGQFWKSPQP